MTELHHETTAFDPASRLTDDSNVVICLRVRLRDVVVSGEPTCSLSIR
jgi:hypothetical protein